MRLAGKVAIVTGAGSGIGKAAALLFLREGARVVAGTIDPADLDPLYREAAAHHDALVAVHADVSREEDAAGLVGLAVSRFGGLDVLFNNAGIEVQGTVTDTADEDWRRVMDVNLKGVFLCCKHAVPAMAARGGGAIVNNASINGIRGNHRLAAYSATKGGVVALTRALALDHAEDNIRVNCLCPGAIEGTRMVGANLARAADPDELRRRLIAKHPLNRLGRPEEVAQAALFLASDESSFITGVVLPVDGGRSIR
jgi:NAD(P)-dependent dehydrogenase (short-subunit alcohol dehydrogenase family)